MTTLKRAVSALVEDLDDFVAECRQANISWNRVAALIAVKTNGAVVVTGKTVQNWFEDAEAKREAKSA